MDGSRDEILAHPAFAANQDRCVGIRDIGDDRANGVHLGAALEQRGVVDHTAAGPQTFARRTTFGSAHACPPWMSRRASAVSRHDDETSRLRLLPQSKDSATAILSRSSSYTHAGNAALARSC